MKNLLISGELTSMKHHRLFNGPALRRCFLLVSCLSLLGVGSLLLAPKAHASGGGSQQQEWSFNANGYTGTLDWLYRVTPTTSDGSSSQDFYNGVLHFDAGTTYEPFTGYQVAQADGSFRVAFLRVSYQSSSYISYFQVYTGTEAADGQSMGGIFQVYTGTRHYDARLGRTIYSYTPQYPFYIWSATLTTPNPITTVSASDDTNRAIWTLDAAGFSDALKIWYEGGMQQGVSAQVVGSAFGDGMVGVMPLTNCSATCPMYFIRTLNTDLTDMEIYNGVAMNQKTLRGSKLVASGDMVEVTDHSTSGTGSWNATFVGVQ